MTKKLQKQEIDFKLKNLAKNPERFYRGKRDKDRKKEKEITIT